LGACAHEFHRESDDACDRESAPEANQELCVFQKVRGDWKIARYCFSTTNPPGSAA